MKQLLEEIEKWVEEFGFSDLEILQKFYPLKRRTVWNISARDRSGARVLAYGKSLEATFSGFQNRHHRNRRDQISFEPPQMSAEVWEKIEAIKIESCDFFTPYAVFQLLENKYFTLADIVSRGEQSILCVRGLGKKKLDRLKDYLESMGAYLGGERPKGDA